MGAAIVMLASAGVVAAQQATAPTTIPSGTATPSPTPTPMDTVTITDRMVPIPKVGPGAPLYSARDIDAIAAENQRAKSQLKGDIRSCDLTQRDLVRVSENGFPGLVTFLMDEIEAVAKIESFAVKVKAAIAESEEVRRKAARGEATQAEVEKAELARQKVVNAYDVARTDLLRARAATAIWQDRKLKGRDVDWGEIDGFVMRAERAGWGLGITGKSTAGDLRITKTEAIEQTDKKGPYIQVYGTVVNTGTRTRQIPEISAAAVDADGWVIASTKGDGAGAKVAAGKSQAVGLQIRPSPDGLTRVVVTFADASDPPARMGMSYVCSMLREDAPPPFP